MPKGSWNVVLTKPSMNVFGPCHGVFDRIEYQGPFGMDRMSANQVGRKQVGQRDESNCNADPTKPPPTNPEHWSEHSPFESIDQKWPGLILSCDALDTGCCRKVWPGQGSCVPLKLILKELAAGGPLFMWLGCKWVLCVCVWFFIYLFIGHVACGILVPPSGFKPVPPALGAQSLNRWTTREVPSFFF